MSAVRRFGLLSIALGFLAACDAGRTDQLENELMLMQERLLELESQVADAQGHAERLSTAASQLEAYVLDVERAVIDLSMTVPRDQLVNAEAHVGNVKTKLTEVRARVTALNNTLDSEL